MFNGGFDMDRVGLKRGAAFGLFKNPYIIFVHDPGLFFIYTSPKKYPGFFIRHYKPSFLGIHISVTEHIKISTNTRKCEPDASYNFQVCVRNFIASSVGCKLPWENQITDKVDNCNDLASVRKIIELYKHVESVQIPMISRKTGCLPPCIYKEYKIEDEEPMAWPFNGILIQFVSDSVLVKTQKKTYDLLSLVADMGGALGMFLGFSFLTFWDGICVILGILKKHIDGTRNAYK